MLRRPLRVAVHVSTLYARLGAGHAPSASRRPWPIDRPIVLLLSKLRVDVSRRVLFSHEFIALLAELVLTTLHLQLAFFVRVVVIDVRLHLLLRPLHKSELFREHEV